MYPLLKDLILLKKISLCKKIHAIKQTHSVKDEFYFQFSFCKKWTGLNDSEKNMFFSDSALVAWSSN